MAKRRTRDPRPIRGDEGEKGRGDQKPANNRDDWWRW
jgi:hypothetical protein